MNCQRSCAEGFGTFTATVRRLSRRIIAHTDRASPGVKAITIWCFHLDPTTLLFCSSLALNLGPESCLVLFVFLELLLLDTFLDFFGRLPIAVGDTGLSEIAQHISILRDLYISK
jgi:hypothetical protein